MATDFSYGNKTINSSGPIKPTGKNQPLDPRTEVKLYADIESIPSPYVGMIITVLEDETNSNKMTDYKVLSLKANASGIANSVVDQVQRYVDYLGASSGGSVSQEDINTAVNNYLTEHPVASGATAEQVAQIQANTAAIGTEELPTTAKTLKGAIAETFQSVSNGKNLIASAITDKGIITSNDSTFQVMADNIKKISSSSLTSTDEYRTNCVLLFEDNFDSETLDETVWNYEIKSNPHNNELQAYTNHSDNVRIENSNLVITAKREPSLYNGKSFTSGKINSNNKLEIHYGIIEAKIKLPTGCLGEESLWPAFWMMGHQFELSEPNENEESNEVGMPWPKCGEIDILERFGKGTKNTACVHGYNYDTSQNKSSSAMAGIDLDFTQYHIYTVYWSKDSMDFFVDGRKYGHINISDWGETNNCFRQPYFIMFNLAVGSKSLPTPPDGFESASMYVDWIRVYSLPLENDNVTSISLDTNSVSLQVGEEAQLMALFDKNDNSYNKTTVWESSNINVAKVYGGHIYAIGNGTCDITVKTKNNLSAVCSVTVGGATGGLNVTGVSLPSSVDITLGSSKVINAVITPSTATNKNVTWSVDNSNVTITPNGTSCTINGATVGSSVITVTTEEGSFTDTCTVNVIEEASQNTNLTFNGSESWKLSSTNTNYTIFELDVTSNYVDVPRNNDVVASFTSDIYPTYSYTDGNALNVECIYGQIYSSRNIYLLKLKISTSKLSSADVGGLTSYLSTNPLTVTFVSRRRTLVNLESGSFDDTGSKIESATEIRTPDYVSILSGYSKITFEHSYSATDVVWFFDENKEFIKIVTGLKTVLIPSGSKYFIARFVDTNTSVTIPYSFNY